MIGTFTGKQARADWNWKDILMHEAQIASGFPSFGKSAVGARIELSL